MDKITLLDFWNNHDCTAVFVVSTAEPGGIEFTHNMEGEGEDYCDIHEVLYEGLSSTNLFDLTGTVEGAKWSWDGSSHACDFRGCSYQKIEVYAEDDEFNE